MFQIFKLFILHLAIVSCSGADFDFLGGRNDGSSSINSSQDGSSGKEPDYENISINIYLNVDTLSYSSAAGRVQGDNGANDVLKHLKIKVDGLNDSNALPVLPFREGLNSKSIATFATSGPSVESPYHFGNCMSLGNQYWCAVSINDKSKTISKILKRNANKLSFDLSFDFAGFTGAKKATALYRSDIKDAHSVPGFTYQAHSTNDIIRFELSNR